MDATARLLTACPLDCPDTCSLEVTVEDGRLVSIDAGPANPLTQGFICAKVNSTRAGVRARASDDAIGAGGAEGFG